MRIWFVSDVLKFKLKFCIRLLSAFWMKKFCCPCWLGRGMYDRSAAAMGLIWDAGMRFPENSVLESGLKICTGWPARDPEKKNDCEKSPWRSSSVGTRENAVNRSLPRLRE